MNKRLTTDMADANGLQRAIRPTGIFNIKKMAADFCSAQCKMDNTRSLINKGHFTCEISKCIDLFMSKLLHAPIPKE